MSSVGDTPLKVYIDHRADEVDLDLLEEVRRNTVLKELDTGRVVPIETSIKLPPLAAHQDTGYAKNRYSTIEIQPLEDLTDMWYSVEVELPAGRMKTTQQTDVQTLSNGKIAARFAVHSDPMVRKVVLCDNNDGSMLVVALFSERVNFEAVSSGNIGVVLDGTECRLYSPFGDVEGTEEAGFICGTRGGAKKLNLSTVGLRIGPETTSDGAAVVSSRIDEKAGQVLGETNIDVSSMGYYSENCTVVRY